MAISKSENAPDHQLTDRQIVAVLFFVATLATGLMIAFADRAMGLLELTVAPLLQAGTFVVMIFLFMTVGVQLSKGFHRPHLSMLGIPLVALGWGVVVGPASILLPFIGIAPISVILYVLASCISFVILLIFPRSVIGIWTGITLLVFSTLTSFGILEALSPYIGIDLSFREHGIAAFWALYFEALLLLACREAMVSEDKSLDRIFDLGVMLVFDQASLALKKVKYSVKETRPTVPRKFRVGKAEKTVNIEFPIGGWVLVAVIAIHKAEEFYDEEEAVDL